MTRYIRISQIKSYRGSAAPPGLNIIIAGLSIVSLGLPAWSQITLKGPTITNHHGETTDRLQVAFRQAQISLINLSHLMARLARMLPSWHPALMGWDASYVGTRQRQQPSMVQHLARTDVPLELLIVSQEGSVVQTPFDTVPRGDMMAVEEEFQTPVTNSASAGCQYLPPAQQRDDGLIAP